LNSRAYDDHDAEVGRHHRHTEWARIKPAKHDACFPAGLLAFSKLLKLHQTEGKISNNLLKRKQSSRKASIVCRWL